MAELKAGGLALIVGARTNLGKENIGKSVTLKQKFSPGEWIVYPDGCEGVSGIHGWIVLGNLTNPRGTHGYGFFAVNHLMPIDGDDFSHEDERKKELINVN